MKRFSTILFLSLVSVLCVISPSYAYNWSIEDQYVGGNDHGYGDVIGNANKFDVSGMEIDITDNVMTVDISTNYVNYIGTYGTELGDLFISTNGWNPYGNISNKYKYDNHSNGEVWEYVFDVSEGNLYDIRSDQDNILTSDEAFGRYTYRNGQEVLVDSTGLTAIASGDVLMTDDSLVLSFNIETMDMDLTEFGLGFHWAMTCGNDTIEGGIDPIEPAPVPEPGMLVLLGLGLIGVLGITRKRVF
jgi:hypothetical protein